MSTFDYVAAPLTANTAKGPTPNVWQKIDWMEILRDPEKGMVFWDDFVDLPTGKYTATQATAGTFALDEQIGGVALADCNSTTVTQGINVQLTNGGFTWASGALMVFETRLKVVDMATGPEFFAGMSEVDTAIIDTSLQASANHIGFESVSDDGVLLFGAEKAGTEATALASNTLTDGTFVKLAFIVEEDGTIAQYVNGVAVTGFTASTWTPIVSMTPSFVCQSDGATDSIMHIDWVRVAVQYNAIARLGI